MLINMQNKKIKITKINHKAWQGRAMLEENMRKYISQQHIKFCDD